MLLENLLNTVPYFLLLCYIFSPDLFLIGWSLSVSPCLSMHFGTQFPWVMPLVHILPITGKDSLFLMAANS